MIEGWLKDDYFIFFDAAERLMAASRYAIERWLPGHEVIGLKGWDDLLVQSTAGTVFAVPSVPLTPEYLAPFTLPSQSEALSPDARFVGKIKWYVQPLALGGNPTEASNVTWVSHEQHGQLVTWWNERYLQFEAQNGAGA